MFLALFGIVFVSVYFASYTINLLESVFLPWEFHRRGFRSPCFPFCVNVGVHSVRLFLRRTHCAVHQPRSVSLANRYGEVET